MWITRWCTCQAWKSAWRTTRWPQASLPSPGCPGQMVLFDLLGPLPGTKNGDVCVFVNANLFRRHAEGYAMTKHELADRCCFSRITDDYIRRWGRPHTFLHGCRYHIHIRNLAEQCMKELLKNWSAHINLKLTEWSEKLNHSLCQTLSYVIAYIQKNREEMLIHVVAARNNNFRRGIGLAPNDVHIGRYSRMR